MPDPKLCAHDLARYEPQLDGPGLWVCSACGDVCEGPPLLENAPSILEGATAGPVELAVADDPGAFAALWNSWGETRRGEVLDQIRKNGEGAGRCWQLGHDDRIDAQDREIERLRETIRQRDAEILVVRRERDRALEQVRDLHDAARGDR